MKKLLMICAAASLLFASCGKDDDNNVTPTGTNDMSGEWRAYVYDGQPVSPNTPIVYTAVANSSTTGSVSFAMSLSSKDQDIEVANYTLSNKNANVEFTKTSGNIQVLSNGGKWNISKLNSTTLEMTSIRGMVIKLTK